MGRKKASDSWPSDRGHAPPVAVLQVAPWGQAQLPSLSGFGHLVPAGHSPSAAKKVRWTFFSLVPSSWPSMCACQALKRCTLTLPKLSVEPITRMPLPSVPANHSARLFPSFFFEEASVADLQESRKREACRCILRVSFSTNSVLSPSLTQRWLVPQVDPSPQCRDQPEPWPPRTTCFRESSANWSSRRMPSRTLVARCRYTEQAFSAQLDMRWHTLVLTQKASLWSSQG
mmetsp:Transcript_81063/g.229643  ORF Transcript_81063/g.229643 Transcript_81063/m.229643 type:complete len:230 (-) Transcript_81063:538-1227(-)